MSVLTVATLTKPPHDAHTMGQLRESVIADAREVAEIAADVLRPRWPQVQTVATLGDPQVEIIHLAEETRVDMIAMGARGFGRLKRVFVGSTSLAVARYASCPVAIVRGRLRPIECILVAVDGSEGSRAALRFLSTLGLVSHTSVILVHVLPPPVPGLYGIGTSVPDRTKADVVMTEAAAALSDVRRPIEHLVCEGDPAREIVRSARHRDVDLVVLGARGLRTLGRLLLGSVSETVVHHVGRPVLIVRERDESVR
jgi:nucleotide-binding universal stress UspA family protein